MRCNPKPKWTFPVGLAAAIGVGLTSVVVAPPVAAEPVEAPISDVLVIAHRGASFYLPEHTFPAYDLAVEMDVDMLECDVMVTADEQLVCMHDGTVNRTGRDGETGAPVSGRVDSYTLAELREMEFGSWRGPEHFGYEIVPLAEQLLCYRAINPNMRFHLETKPNSPRGDELLVELLDRVGYIPDGAADPADGRIVIQSFHPSSLQRIKSLAPSLPTAILGNEGYFEPGETVPDTYDAVAPSYDRILADPGFVARMHDQNKVVHTWTVDDPAVMERLLDYGIDGMFSNRPDLLRALVDARDTGVPADQRGNPDEFARGCPGIAGTVNSIDDVPVTPAAAFGEVRPVVQPGSTVPVAFDLDLRGGAYDGAVSAEVTRPDGSVVEARVNGSIHDGYTLLVRTQRSQPGDYQIVVRDEAGFPIGSDTVSTT
jgi:glycerophosphoryl diester phosphodiesterase